MTQSRNAVSNLISRYRAVLKKCGIMNTFGSLAVAGMLVMGGVSGAMAEPVDADNITKFQTITTAEQGEAFNNKTVTVTTVGKSEVVTGGAVNITPNKIVFTNVTFDKNVAGNIAPQGENIGTNGIGGAVFIDAGESGTTFKGGTFTNNQATGSAGAVEIRSKVVFNDVDFDNNTAGVGNKQGGWGGAIRAVSGADVMFNVTEDLEYTGNKANVTENVNGYTDRGGFLDFHAAGTVGFDIEKGKTLTIGRATEEDKTVDSIVSGHGSDTVINKNDDGTLTVNSSMKSYTGNINVNAGTLNIATGFGEFSNGVQSRVNTSWKEGVDGYAAVKLFKASTLSVKNGATANIGDLNITFADYTQETDPANNVQVAQSAGTVVKVDGTFTAGDVTVKSLEYTGHSKSSDEENSKTVTTTGWGKFNIAKDGNAKIASLTVKDGGTFDKTGHGALKVTKNIHVTGNVATTACDLKNLGTTANLRVTEGKLVADTLVLGDAATNKNEATRNGSVYVGGTSGATLEVNSITQNNGAFALADRGTLQVNNGLVLNFGANAPKIESSFAGGNLIVLGSGLELQNFNDKKGAADIDFEEHVTSAVTTTVLTGNGKDFVADMNLTLLGKDEKFLENVATLQVEKNTQLGSKNCAYKDFAQGGTTTANVKVVKNGSLNVDKGNWELGILTSDGTVDVNAGKLTVDDLSQTAGTISVDAGAVMDVTGKFDNVTYSAAKEGTAAGITVGGALYVDAADFGDEATVADAKNLSLGTAEKVLVSNGGVVVVDWTGFTNQTGKDAVTSLDADQLKAIKGELLAEGSKGLIRYENIDLKLADTNGVISDSAAAGAGALLTEGVTVKATEKNKATITGGYGATELKLDMSSDATKTSTEVVATLSNDLTLTGEGKKLVSVSGADNAIAAEKVSIAVGDNTLRLGMAGKTEAQGEIGKVTLGNGTLQTASGKFTVHGIDGSNGSVAVNGGSLFSKGDVNVQGMSVSNGTFTADCKVALGSDGLKLAGGEYNVKWEELKKADEAEGSLTITGATDAIKGTGTINVDSYFKVASTDQSIDDGEFITINAGKELIDAKGNKATAFGANSSNAIAFANALTVTGKAGLVLNAVNGNIKVANAVKSDTDNSVLNMYANNGKIILGGKLDAKDDIFQAQEFAVTDATKLDGGKLVATKADGTNTFAGDFKAQNGAVVSLAGKTKFAATAVTVGDATADDKDTVTKVIVNQLSDDTGGKKFSVLTNNTAPKGKYDGTAFLQIAKQNAEAKTNTFEAGVNGYMSFGDMGYEAMQTEIANSGVKGISSAVAIGGKGLKLADNGIAANDTVAANTLKIGKNAMLIADVAEIGDGKIALMTGTDVGLSKTSAVRLTSSAEGVKANKTYVLVDGVTSVKQDTATTITAGNALTFTKDNALSTDSRLIKLEKISFVDDGTNDKLVATTSLNKATTVFTHMDSALGGLLDAYATSGTQANAFFDRVLNDKIVVSADVASNTIETAARASVAGGVANVATDAASLASSAAGTRVSMAAPIVATSGAVEAQNKVGMGVWFMPLYQSNDVDGMKAGNLEGGFTSDVYGGALGVDYTFANGLRIGASANIGTGDSDSQGDFNKTSTDSDFYGASLYAGYRFGNFGVSADFGYTATEADVDIELPTAMAMGDLDANVDSDIITIGARGEYKIATGAVDLIPHAGLRYTHYEQDSYSVNSTAGTVFNVDDADMDIWQLPIGISMSKAFAKGAWTFQPRADLSYIYAFGDTEIDLTNRIAGVATSASLESEVFDEHTFEIGLGLDSKYGDAWTLGLDYTYQGSENRNAHGVYGTVRFEF